MSLIRDMTPRESGLIRDFMVDNPILELPAACERAGRPCIELWQAVGACLTPKLRAGQSIISGYYDCAVGRVQPDELSVSEARHVENRAVAQNKTPFESLQTLNPVGWAAADRQNTWLTQPPRVQDCVRGLTRGYTAGPQQVITNVGANEAMARCWAPGATGLPSDASGRPNWLAVAAIAAGVVLVGTQV